MKRILIATLVALSVPLATSTSNANAAAAACSKVGATKIVSGAKFTCRLVSKKRIWVKGPAGKSPTTTVPKVPAPAVSPDTAFASTNECKLKSFDSAFSLGFPRPSFRGSMSTPRILVIPVQFTDTGTNARNYQETVEGFNKAAAYYKAQSFGRTNITFVWTPIDPATKKPAILRMPFTASDEGLYGTPCAQCDRTALMKTMLAAAPASWNVGSYDSVVTLFDDRRIIATGVAFRHSPEYPAPNAPWAQPLPSASGDVHSSAMVAPGNLIHELGHSLLGFIDLYDFGFPARDFTKGWDLMGTGSMGEQSDTFFAWHKWISAWIDDSQVDCITAAGSTIHYLDDLDTANSLNKMVVVRKNATTAIVAEVRTERVVIYRVLMDVWGGSGPIITNDATTFKVNPKVGDTVTESGVSFKILDCRSGGCSVEVTNPAA